MIYGIANSIRQYFCRLQLLGVINVWFTVSPCAVSNACNHTVILPLTCAIMPQIELGLNVFYSS